MIFDVILGVFVASWVGLVVGHRQGWDKRFKRWRAERRKLALAERTASASDELSAFGERLGHLGRVRMRDGRLVVSCKGGFHIRVEEARSGFDVSLRRYGRKPRTGTLWPATEAAMSELLEPMAAVDGYAWDKRQLLLRLEGEDPNAGIDAIEAGLAAVRLLFGLRQSTTERLRRALELTDDRDAIWASFQMARRMPHERWKKVLQLIVDSEPPAVLIHVAQGLRAMKVTPPEGLRERLDQLADVGEGQLALVDSAASGRLTVQRPKETGQLSDVSS